MYFLYLSLLGLQLQLEERVRTLAVLLIALVLGGLCLAVPSVNMDDEQQQAENWSYACHMSFWLVFEHCLAVIPPNRRMRYKFFSHWWEITPFKSRFRILMDRGLALKVEVALWVDFGLSSYVTALFPNFISSVLDVTVLILLMKSFVQENCTLKTFPPTAFLKCRGTSLAYLPEQVMLLPRFSC